MKLTARICRILVLGSQLFYWEKHDFEFNRGKTNQSNFFVLERKRNTRRSNSEQYFFFNDGVKFQVRRKLLGITLCISASVITEGVAKRDVTGFYSIDSNPRGRHVPQNKTSPEQAEEIRRYIKSGIWPLLHGNRFYAQQHIISPKTRKHTLNYRFVQYFA